ncbi:MAG: hypothetical protein R3319_04085, partial [Candidatus Bathyarchaeia archaeon]|nr:hypothetical protein [Candidatus Bathyarchaeia archaeon]
ALTAQGFKIPEDPQTKVIVASKFRDTAVEAVNALREAGVIASMEITKRSLEKTLEYGKFTEMDYVISVGSSLESPVTVYDVKSNGSRNVMLQTFLEELGGQT